MADADDVEVARQGTAAVAAARARTGRTLRLARARLPDVDLSGANLRGANLSWADLRGANLGGANLAGANLLRANLSGASLTQADLRGATMLVTGLDEADLAGANMTDAIVGRVSFGAVDLRRVVGLDSIRSLGRSHLATSSLTASLGRLPVVFLRACGLADWEIIGARLYDPDLTPSEVEEVHIRMGAARLSKPIQTRPVFLSYSHADRLAVDKIEAALQNEGVRVWRDIHDAEAGRLEAQIARAMKDRVVVIVLSATSLHSDWVQHEVTHARKLEKEQNRSVLCPVALDAEWTTPHALNWPARLIEQLREYNILDFSVCKDDAAFKVVIGKLVSGIRKNY